MLKCPTVLLIGRCSQLLFSKLLLKVELSRITWTKWASHSEFLNNPIGRKERSLLEARFHRGSGSHSDHRRREKSVWSLLSKVGGNLNEQI